MPSLTAVVLILATSEPALGSEIAIEHIASPEMAFVKYFSFKNQNHASLNMDLT
ncbi:MAG: hypothetical protein CM15mP65_24580 [Crocinitomicaceae bacterium]|nr:MAG: hypothetical protein CM15mP65_24580 [Crocinitomicaceae bacterium]